MGNVVASVRNRKPDLAIPPAELRAIFVVRAWQDQVIPPRRRGGTCDEERMWQAI
ncbi:hypothetical protein Misp02_49430 [Microtetraspora sp. NBRC 16547]|nr:hypothetical protein Misp02_49430 [Microtetraspora sp. NBRC 16547]